MSAIGRFRNRLARRDRPGAARSTPPEVSVAVVLDGEPAGCRRCLDAVLAQPDDGLEVVVVVLDESLLEQVAAHGDPRVRVVEASGEDRTAGRLVGVRAALGQRVLVLAPESELAPGAVAALVAARRDATAPVVVGGLVGEVGGLAATRRTDLDETPQAARRPILARLLVDRDRLAERLAVIGDDDADGSLAALALLRDGFAVHPGAVVRDVRPGDERVLFRVSPWSRFAAWRSALARGEEVLAGHPAAVVERRRGAVGRDLAELAEAAEDATADQWRDYVDLLSLLVDQRVLHDLGVERRVLVWLAARGVRDDVVRYVADRRLASGALPTEVVDGRVRALLRVPDEAPTHLMGSELVLRARLARLRVVESDLELVLQAGITHLDQSDPGEVVAGIMLTSGGQRLSVVPDVGRDPDVDRWFGERSQDHAAGALVARVPLADLGEQRWRLAVTLEVSGVRREGVVAEIDPRGSATRARLVDGAVEVRRPAPASGVLSGAVVEPGALVGTTTFGAATAALAGESVTLPGVADGPGRWRFALRASTWGYAVGPAPSGRYRLLLDGAPVPAEGVLDALPLEQLTPDHRVLVRRGEGGNLVVRLSAPLADDEVGPRAQAVRQAAYVQVSEPVVPGLVYFQSFTGQAVSDNPGAIQAELHRRAPHLDVRWAVADAAAGVPEGATGVLIRSREWYDVLARASHLVTNVDLEAWFERRPEQRVLQTSHGYPFKRMGLDQWRGRGFPDWRIEQELARSSGTWTHVITPQPSVDSFYREQYAFDGTILATGYPRDDLLTDERAAARRVEARKRLGVGQRQVLLYAPTWRDDLATDHRAALATHFVDLAALSERLGPDWLLLRRGHRFHASAPDGPGVLDVTSYPEVNDLMLAADVALLEYSSMRFDFALTAKPAVYYVPDLDRYAGQVRGFIHDYRPTAPGPLVETLAEVAHELRDLDALTERWSGPIADLNATWSSRQDGHASERAVSAFFAELLE